MLRLRHFVTIGLSLLFISAALSPASFTTAVSLDLDQSSAITIIPDSAAASPSLQAAAEFVQFLPLTQTGDDFSRVPAIWSAAEPLGTNQVALFRRSFSMRREFNTSKLEIVADTRYEVWIDGQWIGRGPARFSRQLVEYDVYELGYLPQGEHTLAVLVQWAPNLRRSESTQAKLQTRLSTITEQGRIILEQTGPHWLTQLTDAWNSASAPVHDWDLIGPTELLDLNQLPSDWAQPGFNDSSWEHAQTIDETALGYIFEQMAVIDPLSSLTISHAPKLPSAALAAENPTPVFRPRTIPFLKEFPMEAKVIRQGYLSPGRMLLEIPPSAPWELEIENKQSSPQLLTIETVSVGSAPNPGILQVNNADLIWSNYHPFLPDLYRAQVSIPVGNSMLSASDVPETGMTISINEQFLPDQTVLMQGSHAGRRLLLASYPQNPSAVQIQQDLGLDVAFNQTPAYLLLDLGRVVYGRVSADISGPSGSLVDIGWDERLFPGTQRALPYPGSLHSAWNQTDSWVLDGTSRQMRTLDGRAGRYVLIAVWGPGPVALENLQIVEERYPGDLLGSFQSSDPLLDKIWQVGVDTLQINKTDAYTDTPWRERGQWWGDAYVESQIDLVTFGGTDLLRRGVDLMTYASDEGAIFGLAPHGSGVNMLDYAMLWVLSLGDLAHNPGNLGNISKAYLTLVQFMDHLESYQNPITGLLDLPAGHWSQTAYIDTLGFRDRRGQSTALNALYYQALLVAAEQAKARGDWQRMVAWQTHADMVKNQVNTNLYLPARSRYAGSLTADGLSQATVSAQAWALSYDLVPPEYRAEVVTSLLEILGNDPADSPIGTYGFFWILRALGENGEIDAGLEVIRSFYGYMVDQGATTWWEWFQADQDYQNSLSHGWGGSPTWFLSTYVLGINAQGEGRWELSPPALETLESASGTVPFRDDMIEVAWQRQSCSQIILEYQAPAGIRGTLNLSPELESQPVWLDEVEINPPQGAVLPGGTHQLTIGPECDY